MSDSKLLTAAPFVQIYASLDDAACVTGSSAFQTLMRDVQSSRAMLLRHLVGLVTSTVCVRARCKSLYCHTLCTDVATTIPNVCRERPDPKSD